MNGRGAMSLLCCFAAVLWADVSQAQPKAPLYEECRLDSIFPAGGRRGTSVDVVFQGAQAGLLDPREIVFDGPGLKATNIKSLFQNRVQATIEIAPDAPLGRRFARVASERSGLTNFLYFVVGALPETVETEPNNKPAEATRVDCPCVVNGRVDPAADVDRFRFAGKAGQKFVAAVAAHAIDAHGQGRNYGIADLNIELLDSQGRVIASADDTLGLDPLIEATLPADGDYDVRLQLLEFAGYPEAVYRLTLGEVPYVVGAFPPAWNRKTPRPIELFGPNISPGTRIDPLDLLADADPSYRLRHVTLADEKNAGADVPVLIDDESSTIERESDGGPRNDSPESAEALAFPALIDARFDRPGDVDWSTIELKSGQKIWIETTAHRWLRSPIDTHVQIFDAQGKPLAENDDDATEPGYEWLHDFKTTDSRLHFTAPADGVYRIRVVEQSGAGGPRAIYRLSVRDGAPDFEPRHFPESIPVWGPGSTACVLVRVDRFADFQQDVEVSIEGLPPGWKASSNVSLGRSKERHYNYHQNKLFLTITAPADGAVGTHFPIRIVGKSKSADGALMERGSLPLNLYFTSDTGFFRASPRSRVALAKSQGPWLEAVTKEIEASPGETISLQARVRGAGDLKEFPIVVGIATGGVACALNSPKVTPIEDGIATAQATLPPETPVGTFGIVVAQTWSSDIRVGMPGPCTELIRLTVKPKPANP